jgi:hypothetical protein
MSKEFEQWWENYWEPLYGSSSMGFRVKDIAKRAWDHQQAKIDLLMLEYCPNEMTEDQVKEYCNSQSEF